MKTPKRKAKDKLEELVKSIVKKRDKNTCQKCLKVVTGSNCHASHVIPVSKDGRLAFDPLNLKVLCYHCHINWWHKMPTESGEWFRNKFPDRYEYVMSHYRENRKLGSISLKWYQERYKLIKDDIDTTI